MHDTTILASVNYLNSVYHRIQHKPNILPKRICRITDDNCDFESNYQPWAVMASATLVKPAMLAPAK